MYKETGNFNISENKQTLEFQNGRNLTKPTAPAAALIIFLIILYIFCEADLVLFMTLNQCSGSLQSFTPFLVQGNHPYDTAKISISVCSLTPLSCPGLSAPFTLPPTSHTVNR